ncbi:putative molybdenum carrier protein [Planctomycetota bacterium]
MPKNLTVGEPGDSPDNGSGERLVSEPKIVSGGQTGVDQAALQVAIDLGFSHGGWCPRGRKCESGEIPAKYQLTEMDSHRYADRTEQNVVDSDATLILYRSALTGGTLLTHRLAKRHNKKHLLIDLLGEVPVEHVSGWIAENAVQVLNVAGPRESSCSGIFDQSRAYLGRVFRKVMPS